MATRKIVSLFTGAGGLDLGLEAAGFTTALCIESNPVARATLEKNRPDWFLSSTPSIHGATPKAFLREANLAKQDIALVVGGPPCQPFSKAGYWATGDSRRLDDPRADTLAAFLSFVEYTLPKALVIENVRGIAYAGKSEGIRLIERRLSEINQKHGTKYVPITVTLDAADFGVPQHRDRVFVIAARNGASISLPPPSTEEDAFRRTAWDALGTLPAPDKRESESLRLRGKWADLIPSIPEGANYLWHTDRGGGLPLFGWRTRYWSFLLKLSKAKPSWTIPASPGPATGPFHWNNRRLSVRELCRLQTFPDSYEITGSRIAAQRQIGNAVPSALAEYIGVEIRKQLFGETELAHRFALMPPKASSTPRRRKTESAPRTYKPAGQSAPHPGVGLGPGAIAREGERQRKVLP